MKVLFEKTDSDNIVRITNGRRPTHFNYMPAFLSFLLPHLYEM